MSHTTFQGPFFDLKFPSDWDHEIIENIPCFFDPDAGWVLQLAASTSPQGNFALDSEMRTYLEHNQLEFQDDRVVRYENAAGIECMACEFMKDNRFWLVQMLARGPRLLVALLNSDAVPDADLAGEISATVGSIRFTD